MQVAGMAEASPQVERTPPRTAFVLAGGGSLGAIEVGMLQALLEWGEQPAFLVGASAGAINAAYFAGDPTHTGARELERIWCALRRSDVLPFNLGSVFGLLRRRGHLVDSSGLRRLLERHLPYRRLEDAVLPVHLVASDMLNGQEVLLSTGAAVDAVLASAAIPGVYPPVRIGERWLVDGGVSNNTPISATVGLGATRVIVLPTGFACALERAPSGAIARAMHALSLLVARQLVYDAERFAGTALALRIVPSLCPLDVSPYDYTAAASLIARARSETRRWLERGGLEQAGIPPQLREHHD
jgi:NTE family protein